MTVEELMEIRHLFIMEIKQCINTTETALQ